MIKKYSQLKLATDFNIEPDAWVDISLIVPPHEVSSEMKFNQIQKSMEKDGWTDRPLLVEKFPNSSKYSAWTGSHRYAAALEAGITEIPVIFIDSEELDEISKTNEDFNFKRQKNQTWDEALYDDDNKLIAVSYLSDKRVYQLMSEEVEGND